MSNEKNLILEVIELVREVQEKVQSDTESSIVVTSQLEEIILLLEGISLEKDSPEKRKNGLEFFGRALFVLMKELELLKEIIEWLLEMMSNF